MLGSNLKVRFSVLFILLIDEFHRETLIIIAFLITGQYSCEFCVVLRIFGKGSEEIAFGRGYEIKVIIFSWLCIAGSGLLSLIDSRWLIVCRDMF